MEPYLEATVGLTKNLIKSDRSTASNFVDAVFVAAETIDSNLSHITVFGQAVRNVRKARNLGTLTAGDQLLCVRDSSVPLTIIAVLVGDITKATA